MRPDHFSALAPAVVLALLGALLARCLRLRGLLASKVDAARVTPERVQLLVLTLAVSGWYLAKVVAGHGEAVPGLGTGWLWAYAASCSVYAAGKALRGSGWTREQEAE
jgi:hypothetical protein